jgi:hypothetical protein
MRRNRSSKTNAAPFGAAFGEHSFGAGNGIRTRDINLGKVALYH